MRSEAATRIRTAVEPAWTDVREHEVLARVFEERHRRRVRRRQVPFLAAAAALLCAAGGIWGWRSLRGNSIVRSDLAVGSVLAPAGSSARWALPDGSEATLSPDARVQIDEQAPARVRLTQTAGEVHYEVRHDPTREFAVRAGGVTVRVRGTAFTVRMVDSWVDVSVQRGRVQVDNGSRSAELGAGEWLHLAMAGTEPSITPAPAVPATAQPVAAEPTTVEVGTGHAQSRGEHPAAHSAAGAVTVQSLLQSADEARSRGQYDVAAEALYTLVTRFPSDPQVASAYFTLGRVERTRGRFARSADAFGNCWRRAPSGSLSEDALAEAAAAWHSAGDSAHAQRMADEYLTRYPTGSYRERMRALIQ